MTQPSLLDDAKLEDRILDRAKSRTATEGGIRTAARKLADPAALAWQAKAIDAMRAVALKQQTFTSDDVWQALGVVEERFGSQMGIVFRLAKRRGWIASTARFQESLRPSRHRCGIRIWQSLMIAQG